MRIGSFPLERGSKTGPRSIGGWDVSSYFGGRLDPITGVAGNHGGMDFPYPRRTKVYAPISGTVGLLYPAASGGGGNWAGVLGEDGEEWADDYWGFGHLAEFAVPNGAYVEPGDLLGYGNSTGHSTGDHGHFSWRPRGRYAYADPYELLIAAAAAGLFPGTPPPAHNPDKPPVEHKCGPGCKDKIMHFLGCDSTGDYWEVWDGFKRHISTIEEKDVVRTQLGIEDRGEVSEFLLNTRVDVATLVKA